MIHVVYFQFSEGFSLQYFPGPNLFFVRLSTTWEIKVKIQDFPRGMKIRTISNIHSSSTSGGNNSRNGTTDVNWGQWCSRVLLDWVQVKWNQVRFLRNNNLNLVPHSSTTAWNHIHQTQIHKTQIKCISNFPNKWRLAQCSKITFRYLVYSIINN